MTSTSTRKALSIFLCLCCISLQAKGFNWTFPHLTAAVEDGEYMHIHWEFRNRSDGGSEIVFVVNSTKDFPGITVGFDGRVASKPGTDIINMAVKD